MQVRIFVRANNAYKAPGNKIEVEVDPFVRIGELKQQLRVRYPSTRLNELFSDGGNIPLSDNQSIGYYNLKPDSTIESCSNPLWLTILYSILNEYERDKENQVTPSKEVGVINRVIEELLNSNSSQPTQPRHCSTLQELQDNIKGIEPWLFDRVCIKYTEFDPSTEDPIEAFLLERVIPETSPPSPPLKISSLPALPASPASQDTSPAVRVPLSDISNRTHVQQGEYIPHPDTAPFAVLAALHAGTLETPSVYSMSIDELKARAQRFTWADLDNNGFACVENTLMPKNLVQREGVLENSRYSLQRDAKLLSKLCWMFHESLQSWRMKNLLFAPQLSVRDEIVLLVDEKEANSSKVIAFMKDKGIKCETRSLPCGNFMWIYRTADNCETLLPFVLQKNTWDDFKASVNDGSYDLHLKKLLNPKLGTVMVLMEANRAHQNPDSELQIKLDLLLIKHGFKIFNSASFVETQHILWYITMCISEHHQQLASNSTPLTYTQFLECIGNESIVSTTKREANVINSHTETELLVAVELADYISDGPISELPMKPKSLVIIRGVQSYLNRAKASRYSAFAELLESSEQSPEQFISSRLRAHAQVPADLLCYTFVYLQIGMGCYCKTTESETETNRFLKRCNIKLPSTQPASPLSPLSLSLAAPSSPSPASPKGTPTKIPQPHSSPVIVEADSVPQFNIFIKPESNPGIIDIDAEVTTAITTSEQEDISWLTTPLNLRTNSNFSSALKQEVHPIAQLTTELPHKREAESEVKEIEDQMQRVQQQYELLQQYKNLAEKELAKLEKRKKQRRDN